MTQKIIKLPYKTLFVLFAFLFATVGNAGSASKSGKTSHLSLQSARCDMGLSGNISAKIAQISQSNRFSASLRPDQEFAQLDSNDIYQGDQNPAPAKITIQGGHLPENKTDRLASVRQLIAQGAFISAINILENIYEKQPDDKAVIELMLVCYTELKAYTKAEMLLQRKIEKEPSDFRNFSLLLETYFKMGNDSLANAEADEILNKFPDNKDIYGSVVRQLVNYGDPDRAMKLIEDGRKKFKQSYLFSIEAASIYETRGAYYDAVVEYFKSIQADTLAARDADRKLGQLIRIPGAPPLIIKALKNILDTLPNNAYALRMLEESYLKNNQYAEAFDICVLLDSLSKSKGGELFQYLRQCRERKLYDQVIKMAEYANRKYAQNWTFSEYRFYYGEALVGTGKYRQAMTNYDYIISQYPQSRDKAEALFEIGNIYRYNLKIYDSARIFYDSVASTFKFAPYLYDAPLEIAKLQIVEGKLDSAADIFQRLRSGEPDADRKEFMDYNLAMILFYRHQYREADLGFRKLMAEYPRGFYLDDALISTLVISDAVESYPEILASYADAIFYGARLMADSVESKLKYIISQGDSPLIGLAYYKLSQHYMNLGFTDKALAAIEEIEKSFPANHFYPYCLKLKGDIYFEMVQKKKEAADIYKIILEKYGDFPFNGEVREKLQQIEGYRLPG